MLASVCAKAKRLDRLVERGEEVEALEPKLVQGQAALFKWKKAQQTSCLGAFSSSEGTNHTAWQVKDDLPRGGLGREWEQAQ